MRVRFLLSWVGEMPQELSPPYAARRRVGQVAQCLRVPPTASFHLEIGKRKQMRTVVIQSNHELADPYERELLVCVWGGGGEESV